MGLLSDLFSHESSKWKSYNNTKQYGDYSITPMPNSLFISRSFSQLNVKNYLKQYNESIKIIGTTKNPEIYFYRYDFAIKRAIALIYMKRYVKMTGDNPVKLANSLIEHKQEFTRQFIDRAYSDVFEKVTKLKTAASKKKRIDAYESGFVQYYDELSAENIEYIQYTVVQLRQRID